jgi:hypothetical protein
MELKGKMKGALLLVLALSMVGIGLPCVYAKSFKYTSFDIPDGIGGVSANSIDGNRIVGVCADSSSQRYDFIATLLTPEEEIQQMVESFDQSVQAKTLTGTGPISQASIRITTFAQMLDAAIVAIVAHEAADAANKGPATCAFLQNALNRADGKTTIPDFVADTAREELVEKTKSVMLISAVHSVRFLPR